MNIVFKNLPNILTVLRMIAVPIFIILMLQNQITAAIIVFLIAEITDVLDGYIARKYDIISTFGRIADPLADKLMQLAALFMLSLKNWIPHLIPWLVLGKEFFMLVSSIYLIRKKYDTSSRWFGKLTSVLLFVAIMLAFLRVPQQITDILFWICVVMAIFAAIMYSRDYILKKNNTEIEVECATKKCN